MPRLSTLKQFLDGFYDTKTAPRKKNKGIITRGKDYVKKIALCTNATTETIQAAIDSKADMLIAHNLEELDEKSEEKKLSLLKDNRITLYIIGISMDTLYVYGTDYVLAKAVGLKSLQKLDKKNKRGLYGNSRISTYEMFLRRINWLTHEASEAYKNNKNKIKKVAIHAGEPPEKRILITAEKSGCDTFLCNEEDIKLKTTAKDLKINLFIANYTATERLALQALKKIINNKFTTKTLLLDETDY
ncbi:MAG: Nif3-like dinuclear metal center hexameric protein [archaeon]|nr:Nif3-like dinuclear metal center hexameric protein [archaeon]